MENEEWREITQNVLELYKKLDKITNVLSNTNIADKKEIVEVEKKPAGITRSDYNNSTRNWQNSLRNWWIKN